MKNNKLWATGLSALFLSTTILSGAPSIVSGHSHVAQAASATIEAAKSALQKAVANASDESKAVVTKSSLITTLKDEIDKANELIQNPDATITVLDAQADQVNDAAKAVRDQQAADTLKAAVDTARTELNKVIAESEKVSTQIDSEKITDSLKTSFNESLSSAKNVEGKTSSTKGELDTAKESLQAQLDKVNKELTGKATAVASIQAALDNSAAESKDKKPTKLVSDLETKTAKLKTINANTKGYTAAAIVDAVDDVLKATKNLHDAPIVVKVSTGDDGKLTVNFKTADGKTIFSRTTGKTTSVGYADAEKDTTYIEVNKLSELVKDHNLTLPKGFILAHPDNVAATANDIKNVELIQEPGYKFNEIYATFKFQINGVTKDAGDYSTYASLQETNTDITAKDVMNEMSADELKGLKKYFYKTGYMVDPKTSTFSFSNDKFYQEQVINFVKKPAKMPTVSKPGLVAYNPNIFYAGQKYSSSLASKLNFYVQKDSNQEYSASNYKVTVTKVYKNSDVNKKNIFKDGSVIFPEVGVNYRIYFKVEPKTGYAFKGTDAKALTFSTTAYTYDSGPVISGIKNEVYKKGEFSYTKGITAYDYVDKKNVKVTYTGKVNPAVKGTYTLTYKAVDSKGFVTKKKRIITVK